MESYNCFSDSNNTSFVDDDGFSNFSLRGKKYHARQREIAASNARANELNTLINAPDVIDTVPVPINPPTLIDTTGGIKTDVPVRPNPTLPLVPLGVEVKSTPPTPTGSEVKPSESNTTFPKLDITNSKFKKFILPSVLGAALLIGLVVFLKKK